MKNKRYLLIGGIAGLVILTVLLLYKNPTPQNAPAQLTLQDILLDGCQTFHQTCFQCHQNGLSNAQLEEGVLPGRSLAKSWEQVPFLDDKSVLNMWELLKPREERTKILNSATEFTRAFPLGISGDPKKAISITEEQYQSLREKVRSMNLEQLNQDFRLSEERKVHRLPGNEDEWRELLICLMVGTKCRRLSDDHGKTAFQHSGENYGSNLSEDKKRNLISFLGLMEAEGALRIDQELKPYFWDNKSCRITF